MHVIISDLSTAIDSQWYYYLFKQHEPMHTQSMVLLSIHYSTNQRKQYMTNLSTVVDGHRQAGPVVAPCGHLLHDIQHLSKNTVYQVLVQLLLLLLLL